MNLLRDIPATANDQPDTINAVGKRGQKLGNFTAIHGVRATGPFWIDVVDTVAHAYKEFGKSGLVGRNAEDLADLGNRGLDLLNPMFAEPSAPSGDDVVHHRTEPLSGFHVAEAFSNNPESNQAAYTGINSHVVNVAKAQFRAWCHSFKQYTNNGTVRLDMFSGEAIACCYELQLQASLRNGLPLHHSHRTILVTCQISVTTWV